MRHGQYYSVETNGGLRDVLITSRSVLFDSLKNKQRLADRQVKVDQEYKQIKPLIVDISRLLSEIERLDIQGEYSEALRLAHDALDWMNHDRRIES